MQLAVRDPARASFATILALQRRYGNAAVTGLLTGARAGTPVAGRENKTGIPDALKAGVEHLSGMPMDDVRVHYNSSKPAEFQARAYTQGTDIHVGPGQERHLPHEAWHAVQQKQGRARPRTQFKGMEIDDDPHLEREAEVMGAMASRYSSNENQGSRQRSSPVTTSVAVPQLVTQLNKKPKITHKTTFSAPNGSADSRTKVGVGEEVTFKSSAIGDWTSGGGSPQKQDGGDTFTWTAPNRAATVTVKLTVGPKKASVGMNIIEPKKITANKTGEIDDFGDGVAGAGMTLKFKYHPMSVSFGNAEAKEVSGPASNVSGYFKTTYGKASLPHDSGDAFTAIGEDNEDSATDTARSRVTGYPKPWSAGSYRWVIPNHFRVNGEGGDGKKFTEVIQAFSITKKGKVTITKAGAKVTRSP